MCKIITVETPNVAAAQAEVARLRQTNYDLLSQNCRTDTVSILEAFGVTGLPGGARPSAFFGGTHGQAISLVAPWPGLSLDLSIYSQTDQYGTRDDPTANSDGYVADPEANVNPNGDDWPVPAIGSVLLRRGDLALFPGIDYTGAPFVVPVGRVVNFRDVPWPDTTIRSWYAATGPFNALTIANTPNIVPRFASDAERQNNTLGLGLPPHFALPQQRTVAGGR
jgi:hypothetical protein